jgi:Major tropism determinant N-terminal domain
MATQVQFRRGTSAETATFTGAVGEVTVDTVKQTCVVHNGSQAGGYPLLREDGTNSALSLGSLSSCALKFASDPNTGIISPGSDQISLVTGGVARLTIDSSGSVTIPGNAIISGNLTVTGTFSSTDNLALIVALS